MEKTEAQKEENLPPLNDVRSTEEENNVEECSTSGDNEKSEKKEG